jgi:hypothetical protein
MIKKERINNEIKKNRKKRLRVGLMSQTWQSKERPKMGDGYH